MIALSLSGIACRGDGIGDLFTSIPSSTAQSIGGWVRVDGQCTTAYRPSTYGHVTYASLTDQHAHRIEARPGAFPEDVTFELDRLGYGGIDGFINVSPGGEWLLIGTSRFGCGDDTCLAIVAPDVCSAQVVVTASGDVVHPDATSAIGVDASGDVIVVYPNPGPHQQDLYAVTKHGDDWGDPVLLTTQSPYAYNQQPAIADDSTKVVFDCGNDSEAGGKGTALCEAATNGSAFRVAIAPEQGPSGAGAWPLHSGDYLPSGGFVFEGEWTEGDEQVWHRPPSTAPSLVNADHDGDGNFAYNDDNTPCALPDGRIVSLWLGRPGANANHEIKVMNADGSGSAMLVTGENTLDVGIGCSR